MTNLLWKATESLEFCYDRHKEITRYIVYQEILSLKNLYAWLLYNI